MSRAGRNVAKPKDRTNPIPVPGSVPSIDELYRHAGVIVGVHEGRHDGCPAHRAEFRRLVAGAWPITHQERTATHG